MEKLIFLLIFAIPFGQIVRYISTFFIILLWVKQYFESKKINFYYSDLYFPLLLLVFSAFISGIINFQSYTILFKQVWRIFEYIIFFWIGFNFVREEKLLIQIGWVVTFSGFIMSISSIIEQIQATFRNYPLYILSYRSSGLFKNPNIFGEYLVLIFPFTYGFLLFQDYLKRVLGKAILIIMGIAMFFCGSHGSWFGLYIAFFIFFFLYYKCMSSKISVKKIITIFISVGLIFIIIVFLAKYGYRTTSFGFRFIIWKTSWKIFKTNPLFGVGVRNFGKYFPKFLDPLYKELSFSQAHNIVLGLLCEQGIVGFSIFLWIFIKIFRKFFVKYHKIENEKFKYICISIISSVTGFLTNGMTDFVFAFQENTFLFWFFIGIIYSILTIENFQQKNLKFDYKNN